MNMDDFIEIAELFHYWYCITKFSKFTRDSIFWKRYMFNNSYFIFLSGGAMQKVEANPGPRHFNILLKI